MLDEWGVKTRYTEALTHTVPLDCTILRIDTDTGPIGWGETMTAPAYYAAFSPQAARAGIEVAAPAILRQDARAPRRTLEAVRALMRGHAPSRVAIDMALWDLAGKTAGLPLVDIWGGRVVDDLPVLCLVDVAHPGAQVAQIAEFRAQGYRLFQIKIGQGELAADVARIEACEAAMEPGERCWFDVNRAWSVDAAMRVIPRVAHLGPLIEQPCETYAEGRAVAERTGLALILDEVITDQAGLVRAAADGVMSVAVLKTGATGGVSEHRHLAETATRRGVPCRIENFYGRGLTLAAVTHLARSLPAAATFGLYDYHLPAVPVVSEPFVVSDRRVRVPEGRGPGLGVHVDEDILGLPVAVYE